jgi:hypothetical protein
MDIASTSMKSVDAISSRKVEGTTVYSGSGQKLGSIDELMRQALGPGLLCGPRVGRLPRHRHGAPCAAMELVDVRRHPRGVHRPIDREQLLRIPRYTNADTADYTPEYTRPFNDHHGAPR